MIGQLLVDSAQALLVVGQGPVEDLPALSAQGRGSVPAPCRRPVPMKASMSSVFIFVPPLAAWVWGQPVDDRFRTHVTKDLTLDGSFPLSAVTSARLPRVTFAPRII